MPTKDAWRRLPPAVHSVNATSITTLGFTHRSVFDTVGSFDERLFPEDLDDADFCMRVSRRSYGVAVLPDAIVWLADRGRGVASHDAFVRGRSRSLLVRRYGRLRHRIFYLAVSPLLGAGAVVRQTLRGHPVSGVAGAMGMLRGLTMSMRLPQPAVEPDEPDADEWRPEALPVKRRSASTR